MTVVVMKKRIPTAQEYEVPAGGTILWFGLSSEVPTGFSIDTAYDDAFVMGAIEDGATDVISGSNTHSHTNPSSGSAPSHTHVTGGSTGANNNSVGVPAQVNNQWVAPDHDHSVPAGSSTSAGIHSHTCNSTESGDGTPPHIKLYWIKATTPSALPINGIIMWDGTLGSVPSSFSLCNGENETPDLRGNFIYGAASDLDIGDSGGGETHSHASQNTLASGTHTHDVSATLGSSDTEKEASGYEGVEGALGGHNHSAWGTSNADANHTHGVPNTGSSSSLPPYLMLYFVMRTV